MNALLRTAGIAVIVAVIVLFFSLFRVDQAEQALVLQLGKPVRVITDPGLKVKLPLLQQVIVFDRRLLVYDAAPAEIITSDKKNLVVDNYSKWRIVDPLRFYQTVKNERGGQARLDDIIYSELRVALGKESLNDIVAKVRTEIMATVTRNGNRAAAEYGIEVVDVRIKRADLPTENEQHVFSRMQAERQRQAKKYRSEGDEEALKITSLADRDRTIILAEAYRQAQEIRGQGELEAIGIYAAAFEQDEEFYDFYRSLRAYRKAFADRGTVVLDRDSELLRYFDAPHRKP
ncbi:MAG: protease modulator HflC [Deltaproteobacteria bacterium]|nr:protease modulator HflC [Candidatus Anaeroferrophillacea bacterium]